MYLSVSGKSIIDENRTELYRINFNGRHNFEYPVEQLCEKASKKLCALTCVMKHMDVNKGRLLIKSFITSQVSYCPLI